MTTHNLYRASAVALVAAAAFSIVGGFLHPIVDGESHSAAVFLDPLSPWAQLSIYVGALFLMFGLPGCYLFFRDRLGRLGLIGFACYFLGNALSAQSHLVVEAFVGPTLAADPGARHLIPASGEIFDSTSFVTLQVFGALAFIASMVLIAISLIRAKGLPTWLGVFLLVGALALLVPFPERQGITGLLIELPRGITVGTLGVLMLRALARPPRVVLSTPGAEHALAR